MTITLPDRRTSTAEFDRDLDSSIGLVLVTVVWIRKSSTVFLNLCLLLLWSALAGAGLHLRV